MPRPPRDRTLLILDLDETLIFANEEPLDRPADFRVYDYHVYRRPHLDHFLDEVVRHFDLAVWSSADDLYVQAVARALFPGSGLQFVWGRSRATLRRRAWVDGDFWDPWDHRHYLKPLAKVKKAGWPLERVLIVDDTPEKCALNYGNAIYPRAWEGAEDDDELVRLANYLVTLKDLPNVRRIEKRQWRSRAH